MTNQPESFRRRLRKGVVSTLKVLLALPGKKVSTRMQRLLCEAMSPQPIAVSLERVTTPEGAIIFDCPGDLARWRVETFFTKEPETLEWVDGFDDGDVMWDIGANMGIYSLYAAVHRNARVLAFEPAAANYYLLNRNIELNGLSNKVTAYCLAFSDDEMLAEMHMRMTEFAGSMSSFGVNVDNSNEHFDATFLQGMLGISIDTFIERYAPPFPNHLKIDVDSIEDLIIRGAANTLKDPRLRSVSVELDSARVAETEGLCAFLAERGLTLATKRQSKMISESEGLSTLYNYMFSRSEASS